MSDASSSSMPSLSALSSSKRTKILFETDPQSAFLPSADPAITQLAVYRRKRRNISQQHQQKEARGGGGSDSTALTLTVSHGADAAAAGSASALSATTSTTLATVGGPDSTQRDGRDSNFKSKGILVVRAIQRLLLVLMGLLSTWLACS